MRVCHYSYDSLLKKVFIFPIARIFLSHYIYKFGIYIPYNIKIGPGFYVGHFGCIVVNSNSVIGKNCNLSQGVTIGQSNRGPNKGYPILGDDIYIGPDAKVFGNIIIGNNVAIGANCVVTKNIPDNSVVVGVPGRVISDMGSFGYVNRIDYDNILKTNYKL
jgi:serine O-acetyltransferase